MQVAERWRFKALIVVGVILLSMLVVRLVFLQLTTTKSGSEFLQQASERRLTSFESIPGVRGEIVDRNGHLLAYSTPTTSIGFRHGVADLSAAQFETISSALQISPQHLEQRLASHSKFVYLKRRMPPALAESALKKMREELNLSAKVFASLLEDHTEYKRFYPSGEITAHVVGYTDVNDRGQEGIELAFESDLKGVQGKRQIVRNAKRQIIGESRLLEPAVSGARLALTLDLQLQTIAYSELKAVVEEYDAYSASMVILDVESGDILALANQPSYNANDRSTLIPDRVRNRALLDVFEPGSTVKPFTFAAGLQSGSFSLDTSINTAPGHIRIDGHSIHDPVNYGEISAAQALVKSSQVATAKLAMLSPGDSIRHMFGEVGFGEYCATGFPGEQVGYLPSHRSWKGSQKAILGYGYGLEVNTLQLARAYAVLGDNGKQKSVRLVRGVERNSVDRLPVDQKSITTERLSEFTSLSHQAVSAQVMDSEITEELRGVLQQVVERGTGKRAKVRGYDVAGKTGTTHKVERGVYLDNQYRATFAGMLPADNPRLVAVVTVDRPKGAKYYGGEVAAPVFSRVMTKAARIMNIPPSNSLDTALGELAVSHGESSPASVAAL